MAQADKFKLCVGLTGEAYICTLNNKGRMTDNRRELDRNEIITFIRLWVQYEAARLGGDNLVIMVDDKPVIKMKVLRSLLEELTYNTTNRAKRLIKTKQ